MAAIAGKVAITPKGDWDSATQYGKLDFVFHKDNSYVAKKESVGIEPGTDSETWMLSLRNGGSLELDEILNGTLPVGDSLKLGGKDASEYALIEEIGEFTDFSKIILTETKNVYVSPSGSDETGDGTQENPWGTIQKAVDECPVVDGGVGGVNYNIYLDNGVYDENITVRCRNIRVVATNTDATNITTGTWTVTKKSRLIVTTPMTIDISSSSANIAITVSDSSSLKLTKLVTIIGSGTTLDGVRVTESTMITQGLTISNCTNALRVGDSSVCSLIQTTTINNCDAAMVANAGIIMYMNATFTGVTTQFTISNGGRIYTGAQTSVGKY